MTSSPGEGPAEGDGMAGNYSTQPLQDGSSLAADAILVGPNETDGECAKGSSEEHPIPGKLVEDKKKRSKRKNKSTVARGPGALSKSRGTGFEEFYCDPPVTPDEALEEQTNIYPPHRAFVDRIEECIQRFRARRRLDSDRLNIFNKFLAIGGIDGSPRQFQGGNSIDLEGATSTEIREIMASDVIHRTGNDLRFYNPNRPDHWDVDFAGVVSGFFSERIFKLAGSDLSLIKMAADLVQNFLNYVLHHDVCPEYADNIHQAKAVCDQALDQIPRIFGIWQAIPGDFSIAAQTLYCRKEGEEASSYYLGGANKRMDHKRAMVVFMATVATMDSDSVEAVCAASALNAIHVMDTAEQAFEILELRDPSEEVLQLYRGVKDPASGAPGTIEPCGLIVLKPITIQDGWDTGLCTDQVCGDGAQESLIINCSIMRYLMVGMKVKLVVCTLNIGIKFIKELKEVCPSYYTFLPQELMLNYREPVLNERPAPGVDDLEAEDEQPAQKAKD